MFIILPKKKEKTWTKRNFGGKCSLTFFGSDFKIVYTHVYASQRVNNLTRYLKYSTKYFQIVHLKNILGSNHVYTVIYVVM